jgi:hypothetical protein
VSTQSPYQANTSLRTVSPSTVMDYGTSNSRDLVEGELTVDANLDLVIFHGEEADEGGGGGKAHTDNEKFERLLSNGQRLK